MDKQKYINVVNKMDLSNKDRATLINLFNEISNGSDYNNLENKPSINGVTVEGNITSEKLGIPSNVANALLKTEQTLTDEEKQQVQTNIGVKDTVDAVGVGETETIELTAWKENYYRSTTTNGLVSSNNYMLSNIVKLKRGDKINIYTYGTSYISIISEVANNDEHTFIRTLINGNGKDEEYEVIADKDMYIEFCYYVPYFRYCYKQSSKVYQHMNIPQGGYNRALFEAAGAVYNEETGYYELNGLTDLTEDEMLDIYTWSKGIVNMPDLYMYFSGSNIRTTLNCNGNYKYRYLNKDNSMNGMALGCSKLEVFQLYKDNNIEIYTNNLSNTFASCTKLRSINNVIVFYNIKTATAAFSSCVLLSFVRLKNVNISLSFQTSPLINYESLKYLIDNAANTNAITITVHATTYGYLTGTIEPTEQVGGTTEEWQAIVTAATEKNISFASA